MQFLYYISGQRVATPALIKQSGLANVISTGDTAAPLDTAGPDGKIGLLLSRETAPVFSAEKQLWFPPAAERTYWLGMDRENPPAPAELKRDAQIKGYDVQLADGNTWHIPTARRLSVNGQSDTCCLPMRYVLSGSGKPSGRILEQYAELWERSGELAHTVYRGGQQFTNTQAIEILACALAVNYRVGYWETLALGLLSDSHMRAVIDAIVDFPGFVEMLKKNGDSRKPASGAKD